MHFFGHFQQLIWTWIKYGTKRSWSKKFHDQCIQFLFVSTTEHIILWHPSFELGLITLSVIVTATQLVPLISIGVTLSGGNHQRKPLVDLGGMPSVCPLRVWIFSFWHTKFLKNNHFRSQCPPTKLTYPYGESWIHHWKQPQMQM